MQSRRLTLRVTAALRLMRPLQWLKNVFVAAPLFFSKLLFDPQAIINTAIAVAVFSLVASILYIVNDWCDREADRAHPRKSIRPLAARLISPLEAAVLIGVLAVCAAALLWKLGADERFIIVLAIYSCVSLLYSLVLKHVPLLELFIVASGYVVRVLAGSFALNVEPSQWILAASGLIALLITSAKRRADIDENLEKPNDRRSLEGYTVTYLNHVISISAAMTVLAYILFTVSPYAIERFHSEYLFATSVFVGYGVLRFVQRAIVGRGADDPTWMVVTDPGIVASVVLWGGSMFGIIYGNSTG
jgi:decaprenyl-phosphate phosphoribosyltransferase